MGDTPMKVKQLVKTSHFAFFTVVIILAILLYSNNIVNAQTVSGTTVDTTWSYDDSNMESAVIKYKLYMPEETSFLNQEDSGFPYQMPCYDNDGLPGSYTKFPGALGDKNFIDTTFVNPSTFNNTNLNFKIPDSFTADGNTYNTGDFTSANMFVVIVDYQPYYHLVLCNDSSQYNAQNFGAGFNYWRCVDGNTSNIFTLTFNQGMNLVGIHKPLVINGIQDCLFSGDVALCGNSPIYSYYTDAQPSNRPNAGENWFQFVTSDRTENINYIQLGNGPTYEDGSGGTEENNLYMRTADWTFKIPKYCNSKGNIQLETPQVNNWGEGQAIFTGLLNDWQKANSNKLGFKYDFYVSLYIRYENDVNNDIGAVYKNFFGTIEDTGIQIFIDNNCSRSFTVDELFDLCVTKSGQSVSDYLDELKTHPTWDILDTKWFMDCSAVLYQVSDNSHQSGEIKERYDFCYQTSKELENTITENKDPYIDDDGNTPDNDENDNSSEESSKNGQIILTNNDNDNNNQTVTINNGHDEIINTLYEKLVPADSNSNGGLTERFLNLTQSNRWFDLMATAMPYIPMEFWNTMYHLLVVCLGITGIAFLIWIVCHII